MAVDASASLPLLIKESLKAIPDLVNSRWFRFGRSGENTRAMRSDRGSSLIKVLTTLVRCCDLQHAGLFCHIDKTWARPMSVPEVAALCGVSEKTVFRCFYDLKDLGLIESQQIKRKNPVNGQIEVSIGIRRFTPLFWEKIRLTDLFKRSCEWARQHAKRRLLMPFKAIKQKVKEIADNAKNVVNSVMKTLDADTLRIKKNADDILKMIRQKK